MAEHVGAEADPGPGGNAADQLVHRGAPDDYYGGETVIPRAVAQLEA